MNLFQRIGRLFRREAIELENTQEDASEARTGGRLGWYSANPALCVTTVYRCVKLLSESVASLDVNYKKRGDDGVFENQLGSRLWYLLNVQPDIYMNAFDMKAKLIQDILLHGNAYLVPVWSTINPWILRLVYVPANSMSHDLDNDTYTVQDSKIGLSGTFRESEVIHIKGFGHNPKHGLSVLQFASQAVDIASMGNDEALNRMENGGTVRGIITSQGSTKGFGEYQDKEMAKLAKDIDRRINVDGQRITFLNGEIGFTPTASTSADMQFMEMRKFAVREICRAFGVHPSFVFDDTSNNYKSAEMANAAFLANTLNPLLRKIEIELLRKLCTSMEAPFRKFEFDRSGLTACDLESKIKYQSQLVGAGLATPNELRRLEDRPLVEGGDTVLVSANLKAISEVGKDTPATVPTKEEKEDKDNED